MNKESIKIFFDSLAPSWDKDMIKNDDIINKILDEGHVCSNKVLDVACGTGVLIPYYLDRKCSVTGIDISSEMIRIASYKFKDVKFICGDVEEYKDDKFDNIVIYNAFPHFIDPDALIKHLASLLNENGYLNIAHGMSRDKINKHHEGRASDYSRDLLSGDELASIMNKYLDVELIVDNDEYYHVIGKKVVRPFYVSQSNWGNSVYPIKKSSRG